MTLTQFLKSDFRNFRWIFLSRNDAGSFPKILSFGPEFTDRSLLIIVNSKSEEVLSFMRNKLLRKGRRLTPEQQILRLEMISQDIEYLERIFDYTPVQNEIQCE